MTLRHLKLFIAVAESGKMSLAAAKYYISQPTVSQAIAELEHHYQVRLFDRLSKRLYITEAGKTLLENARRVVATFDSLESTMKQAYTKQPLRFGATVTVGTCVINPILELFQANHPQAPVRVLINNTKIIEEKLLASELDFALVEGEIKHTDLIITPVMDDLLVAICSPTHVFAKQASVPLEELAMQPLILRENGSGTRELFEDLMQAHGLDYNVAWTCNNSEAIKNAVRSNHGISVLSFRLVESELKNHTLCLIPIQACEQQGQPAWKRKFSLVTHKDKSPSTIMVAMLEAVHQFAQTESTFPDFQFPTFYQI